MYPLVVTGVPLMVIFQRVAFNRVALDDDFAGAARGKVLAVSNILQVQRSKQIQPVHIDRRRFSRLGPVLSAVPISRRRPLADCP